MTVGIYSLYWEVPDLIYIGQSVEIENRFIRHLWELRNSTHSNYKVQNTFNIYGEPTTNILQVCAVSDLNALEVFYTDEFDSIDTGLNIVSAGSSSSGTEARNSKYSKNRILRIFSLLYRTALSARQISILVNVPVHIVQDIMSKRTHYWIFENYPDKTLLMDSKTILRKTTTKAKNYDLNNRLKGKIISPDGIVVPVINAREFARENIGYFPGVTIATIANGITRVLSGTRASYKKWTLTE